MTPTRGARSHTTTAALPGSPRSRATRACHQRATPACTLSLRRAEDKPSLIRGRFGVGMDPGRRRERVLEIERFTKNVIKLNFLSKFKYRYATVHNFGMYRYRSRVIYSNVIYVSVSSLEENPNSHSLPYNLRPLTYRTSYLTSLDGRHVMAAMAAVAHLHKTQSAADGAAQQQQQQQQPQPQQPQQEEGQQQGPGQMADPPQVRAFLPGAVSLIEQLDTRVLVILRDGRHLVGTLRSLDQFSNLVLEDSLERHVVENKYADIYLGLYMPGRVRGDGCRGVSSTYSCSLQGPFTFKRKLRRLHVVIVIETHLFTFTTPKFHHTAANTNAQADEEDEGAGENMKKVEMDELLDAKAKLKNAVPLWDF